MKRIIISIFIASCALHSIGQTTKNSKSDVEYALFQSRFSKANNLFDRFSYYNAAKLYEDLAAKNFDLRKVAPKLGDCYYNMGKTDKAEYWYEKTVQFEDLEAEYYFKYAQALRSNKKYDEANIWIKKFQQRKEQDSRAINYLKDKDYSTRLSNQNPIFEVSAYNELNTEYSDFGAVQWNNKVAFVSGRDNNPMIKNTFAWNEKPFLDIFICDGTKSDSKSIYNFSKKINSNLHEGPACFDTTGQIVYFTRNNFQKVKEKNNIAINNLLLFKAQFNGRKWIDIEPMPFNSDLYSVGHPSLSKDGKRLYFTSNMPGGFGGTDIYYVDVLSNGYGTPVNLGSSVNTEGNEMFPFINNEFLYFSSDGHVGLGGLDVFRIKLLSEGKYSGLLNLGAPVNSSKDDFCFVLNKDEMTGFLSSNRDGGKGDDDIYLIKSSGTPMITIKGIVIDSITGQPLANSIISITNDKSLPTKEIETDDQGKFSFLSDLDINYDLKVVNEKYAVNYRKVSTVKVFESEILLNIPLINYAPVRFISSISDKRTNEKLSGVSFKIQDLDKNRIVLDTITAQNEDLFATLPSVYIGTKIKYEVILSKPGYLSKSVFVERAINDFCTIKMNEVIDVNLDKIEIGTDIGKLLNINPIYFDLGKWDIRADAAKELDKIVKTMIENPSMVIELGSHTDCRGSAKFNLNLSDKRAKSSAAYIISKGISKDRIYGKGYGESKLINDCKCEGAVKSSCPEDDHQKNRRTEFIIQKI